ncbi:efflux RND transporter periplasmic adaptor subunit [Actinoplanes sp. NEAU-A12]|uniref:Efflux RND transporter periplasmic adaptor subunit n=1 Tax=Actinoplanes sandaracinus TaxID=3045177 RepID=A0ABT6WBK3_9ACTN|nr:efflux RND transporter periplasmic adaptor subunit [Actinoplanes sandaracinus]MDI6097108.1 efflux RND transporter periplasmic adaptor subunit [Actinoplanes sandaracinus]
MSEKSGEKRSKRRIRLIGAAIVAIGAVTGGALAALNRGGGDTPAALVVAIADRGAVTLDVATVGTVEPAITRALSFTVAGTVESVGVRAGNRVTKGQTLAVLDDAEATDDVRDAEAGLAEAQARLGEARTVAARTTASATTCAQVVVAAASACPTMGFPDTGADRVLTAEQEVYRAARAVEKAEKALGGTTLTAPIAGTVVAVEGEVGDQVEGGSAFISLADTHTMQVRADFPEADAGSLTAGQTATVTLAGSDSVYDAQVLQVDPAGTSDGTLVRFGVVVAFADSPADLLAGQRAQVKVRTGEVTDVVRVPSTAVHDIAGGAGTVLVRDGNQSVERTVAVGLRGDQYTEITDGLAQGDQVVRSW